MALLRLGSARTTRTALPATARGRGARPFGAGAGAAPGDQPAPRRPLEGVRVLEMGQLIAGPFTGTVLAYFGAEVIKIEPPGAGDQLRKWRALDASGESFWTRSMMRNKKCVTLNMREPRGRALAHRPGRSSEW